MNEEMKPIRCGCGGEAQVMHPSYTHCIVVMCGKCGIKTPYMNTEAEAITAWNRAMTGERTAKVSNQIFNNSNPYTVGAWIGTCECGELVSYSSKYCHMCGARLEWE